MPGFFRGRAMSTDLLTSIDGAVARITFNRPEVRNAINSQMLVEMCEFLQRVEHDPDVRCVVLSGAGEHFVSGADIGGFEETLKKPGAQRRSEFESRVQSASGLFLTLARMQQPVIASVQGAAAGAAIGFIAGADFCVCGQSAIFILAHVRIGACPDGSTSYYLPRVLGVRKAKELAMLGNKISAEQARDFGLVNWVVPDTKVDEATEDLVKKIVDAPRLGIQRGKHLINESLDNTLEQQLQLEAESFAECAGTDDFVEGVSAFLEKRDATFNRGS